jgi:SAM-dependent methyltransferase
MYGVNRLIKDRQQMKTSFLILKDFDESTYLEQNPDVYAAVKDQSFKSGLEHCLMCGVYEGRPGITNAMNAYISSRVKDIRTPPNNLRVRVHGDDNLTDFNNVGKLLAYNLFSYFYSLLQQSEGNKVLDFGCGCGRVISYLSPLFINNEIYGCDIDGEAIDWCERNLSNIGTFINNDNFPPLPFDDNYFNIVYSISVFTHLPEDMQLLWLEELKRITQEGAYLLITTHGKDLAPVNLQKVLNTKGFYYGKGSGTDGLPAYYQTSFHTEEYIRERWSDYFEIINIEKKGIMNHQDLVVCRRIS